MQRPPAQDGAQISEGEGTRADLIEMTRRTDKDTNIRGGGGVCPGPHSQVIQGRLGLELGPSNSLSSVLASPPGCLLGNGGVT